MEPLILSSTEVRNAEMSGASHEELLRMVPPRVADYIEANGLYRREKGD